MPDNKKIYDKSKVFLGLIIFFVLITFPFWKNHRKVFTAPVPQLTQKAKAAKECVLPASLMKTEHMQLLNNWRDQVVREGKRKYICYSGKAYDMSLSNTCLDCHSNKAEFCDRCHNYASLRPYCWDCHVSNPKDKN